MQRYGTPYNGSPAAGPVVSSLRVQQGGVEFQQLWQLARSGCEQILNWHQLTHQLSGKAMTKHIVDHYTMIYRLASNPGRNVPGLVKGGGNEAVAGKDEQSTQVLVLYYLLREMLKSHLETRVRPRFAGKTGMDILRTYEDQWKKFVVGLDLLSVVFRYLHNHWNKQGIPAGHITTSTKPLGLTLWSDYVVAPLKGPLENELLACIREDRERSADSVVDGRATSLVRSVVATFGMISNNDPRRMVFLSEVFDNPYTRDTDRHYNSKAAEALQQGTVMEYVAAALSWTKDEVSRVERYSTEKSAAPSNIRKTLLTCLVESRVEALFQPVGGMLLALTPAAMHDLGMLFHLIQSSEPTVLQLASLIKQRVIEDGLNTVAACAANGDQGAEFILSVLELHRKYRLLIEERFDSNKAILTALRDGCESFINNNPHHKSDMCAEFLARHANTLLRPSQTRDDDLELGLKEIVEIFDFFADRDVFQSTYAHLLCQRLIQGNMREEWEDRAISAFREKCGRDVTYHWERMLADATTTRRENRDKFVQFVADPSEQALCSAPQDIMQAASIIEFQPLVVTSAWWPLKPDPMPSSSVSVVGFLQKQFEGFYKKFQGGRTLSWMQNLSSGVVEARVNPSAPAPLTCTISSLQWELLNLLNSPTSTTVTFQAFKSATGSADVAALQRAVFAFLRVKMLTLENPAERDVEKQSYVLNATFTSAQRRINFIAQLASDNAMQRTTTNDDLPPTVVAAHGAQQVMTERRFAVQAAIVRVMKSRRTATYAELFAEVEGMLRKTAFAVTAPDLKANLEALIEKDFVERSASDANVFVYLT
jgi:cullin 1